MLRRLECTGFKSFNDFGLNFRPGLNVLVGPNGSGKTNIITLLEFLSILNEAPLVEAIGKVGGAGSVFRKNKDSTIFPKINFTVFGHGNFQAYRSQSYNFIRYRYSAEITLSAVKNTIFFSKQRIQLSVYGKGKPTPVEEEYGTSLDIETHIEGERLKTQIHKLDHKLIDVAYFGGRQKGSDLSKSQILETSAHMVEEACEAGAKEYYLFQVVEHFINDVNVVTRDLINANAFNIAPAEVRKTEDIGTLPIIQANGAGLAATIYALQSERILPTHRRYRYLYGARSLFQNPEKLLRKIIDYTKIVSPNILGVEVDPDPIDAKLRVFVRISYENGVLRMPLSLVSDGTAKWFTLVTAIITNESLFAIEEPENFLHPLMQIEIVRILKEQYERAEEDRFALISTHSETILNRCEPNDVIIVEMVDGYTRARRPLNSEDLVEQIRETGFGLGYYYISGAVE